MAVSIRQGGDGGRFGCGSEFLQFHHAHGVREGRRESGGLGFQE